MRLPSIRLFLTGLFVTFGGSFHFGYQLSIVNPTQDLFWSFFNSSYGSHYGSYLTEPQIRLLWSTVTGILFLGALVGGCLMPWAAERFGRRKSLFASSMLFIQSSLPSALAYHTHSFELYIFGRFSFGVAIGLASGFQGLYLGEISPKQHRGFMGALTGLMIELGLLIGSVIALPTLLGTETLWPVMYWLEMAPSALLLVALFFSHESPSYLLAQGQEERAKMSIQSYHAADHEQIQDFLLALQQELELERNSTGLLGLYKIKLARKGTLLGALANLAVGFSGVVALSFFATYLLTQTGFSPLEAAYANVGVTGGACLSACLATWATEHLGRRPLFLFACVSLTVCDCIMLVLLVLFDHFGLEFFAYIFVAANVLFMLAFGVGMAPIVWFITTEMVPQNTKAASQGFAIIMQYLSSFIAPIIFLPLEGKIGPYSFLLFIIPLIFLTFYFYRFLPETKNKHTSDVLKELYAHDTFVTDSAQIEESREFE